MRFQGDPIVLAVLSAAQIEDMDHLEHSNVIPFPTDASSNVEVEAAQWLGRLNANLVTKGDIVEHAMWRAESAEHDRVYREMERTWLAVGVGKTATASPTGLLGGFFRRRALSGLKAGLMAAGMVLALGGTGLVRQYMSVWQYDYHTQPGEIRKVALSDGSTLTLNGGAAVDVDIPASGPRVVKLARGEAFFEVTHNVARPFLVDAGSAVIKDLGTGFSVKRDRQIGSVSVDHGVVEVSAAGNADVLGKGQTVRFGLYDLGPRQPIAIDLIAAWRRGLYVAENRPLGEVLADLDEYRRGGIVVLDPVLRQRRINAVVKLDNLDAWLDTLGQTEGVKVQRWGSLVIVNTANGGRKPVNRTKPDPVRP